MNKGCYKLYTDGGCLGNPGKSAAGMVIFDDMGREVYKGSVYLGEGTNNTAEYSAVLEGIKAAKYLKISSLEVYSDSELIIRQINKLYKVKSDTLRVYKEKIDELAEGFEKISFIHLKREFTSEPHNLVESLLKSK